MVFTQTVNAMTSETITHILNNTFEVNFTSKQIDSLRSRDRERLEVVAEKVVLGQSVLASGVGALESRRQEALGFISALTAAQIPDDPFIYGVDQFAKGLAGPVGKIDMARVVGQILLSLPTLIKGIDERYELPVLNAYLLEVSKGKSHEEAWKYATTGDNQLLIEKGMPVGWEKTTEEKAKKIYESLKLATNPTNTSEWKEVGNIFEVGEQKGTFGETIKAKMKSIWEQVKDKLIPIARAEGQPLQPITQPFTQLVKPSSNASQQSLYTAQQQLTVVKDLPFTQTFSGGYEKLSVSPYKIAVYGNTDPGSGVRTGAYPGAFTSNYSITATSTQNNTFSSYSSGTFSATMSGKVSGFLEGTLKGTGTMNMTSQTTGGTQFNLSGPITIEPSGNLTSSTNGTFTLGDNSGTTTGTWTQTPK